LGSRNKIFIRVCLMGYNTIEYARDGRVGIIRLNRPERMNAVNEEMYREIQEVLQQVYSDTGIRSLILTGSVLKRNDSEKQAFCAGADLKKHSGGERNRSQQREYIMLAHDTTRMIYDFPRPIIAAVNGPARGAGAEMAVNCDFILMARGATIAFPETGLGTFVGGGVTQHLPRIIGLIRAKELIYTGRIIDADAAVDMGLALKSLPLDMLHDEAILFARELSERAPISMQLAKKHLHNSYQLEIASVLQLEAEAILSCMDTEDWHEGVRSFAEKRKPDYKGR
jgi:enoyl-CoA hydratase